MNTRSPTQPTAYTLVINEEAFKPRPPFFRNCGPFLEILRATTFWFSLPILLSEMIMSSSGGVNNDTDGDDCIDVVLSTRFAVTAAGCISHCLMLGVNASHKTLTVSNKLP
mmetsp:Transcript_19521/g.42428  ORF Transcript_19521/g.42428 Transcript_19521/m.42428 type:complete len:111 (-) Transcript_19521:745-1077(-)